MSENLPILWEDKVNSPELLAFLAQYGSKYCMSAEEINQLRNAVNEMSEIQKTTFLGVAEPTDTPDLTDAGYWEVITPGIYTFFGGKVLGVDERGLISLNKDGVFKLSKVAYNFDNYVKKNDLNNNLLLKSDLVQGKNMFNKNTVINGFGISLSGTIFANQSRYLSDYIAVLPNTAYYNNSDKYNYCYFDSSKNVVSGAVSNVNTFTTPSNVYFVRISSSNINTTQFELGSVATTYEEYTVALKTNQLPSIALKKSDVINNLTSLDTDKPVSALQTNILANSISNKADLVQGKNLFDKSKSTDGFYVLPDGRLLTSGNYFYSDYIPVIVGQQYMATYELNFCCFYNSSKVNVSTPTNATTSVTIPAGVSFIRMSFTIAQKSLVQFELGAVQTTYESYYFGLNPLQMPTYVLQKSDVINNLTSLDVDKPVSALQTNILANSISNKADLVQGKNLFDKSKSTDGFYVVPDGRILSSGNYFYSDYIPVIVGQQYRVNYELYNYCFYNASKVNVSTPINATTSVTIPAGVSFIRMSFTIAKKSLVQFELGAVQTTYEPFSYAISESQLPERLKLSFGKQAFDLYTPTTIYSCVDTSGLINSYSQRATTLYLEHFVQMTTSYDLKLKPYFKETNTNRYSLPLYIVDNPVSGSSFNNGMNLVETITKITTGGGLEEKEITFKHRSVKTGIPATNTIDILCFGDSVTAGVNSQLNNAYGIGMGYSDYIKALFAIDKVRFSKNVGYNTRFVGTSINTPRSNALFNVTMNGYNVNEKVYHEGNSSRSLYTQMMLPYFTINKVRLWSVLGLKTVYGVEYASATQLQKDDIYKTYYGQFLPTKDDYYIRAMLSKPDQVDTYIPVVGDLDLADTKYNDLFTSPDNKFYHKSNESVTRGHCFSLSEYLSRYKTIDKTTGNRLVVGTTAGTKVTDVNAYDVCEPSILWNQHGFNGAYPELMTKFVNYIKEYNTTFGKSVILGMGVPDFPFQNFKELYPEFANNMSETFHRKESYTNLVNIMKSLEDEANNIFHVNIGIVAPTSYSQPYIEINEPSDLSGINKNKTLIVASEGQSFIHPNSIAHAAWGHQIYCWIKYLCSLGKL